MIEIVITSLIVLFLWVCLPTSRFSPVIYYRSAFVCLCCICQCICGCVCTHTRGCSLFFFFTDKLGCSDNIQYCQLAMEKNCYSGHCACRINLALSIIDLPCSTVLCALWRPRAESHLHAITAEYTVHGRAESPIVGEKTHSLWMCLSICLCMYMYVCVCEKN